ncbi:hypothetical protein PIB30_115570, partial [Stylosanthes scabra]|nr:hypothetical protein [Stylosanthes scabra]
MWGPVSWSLPQTVSQPNRLYGGILILPASSQRRPGSQQLLDHTPHRPTIPLLEISDASSNRVPICTESEV